MTPWTFETLAEADRDKLEEVVRAGDPPEYDQVEGYIYCGWNHEWVGRLSGEKFKKGFRRRDERTLGYNEICRQDGDRYKGEWEVKLKNGRPIQVGYFRVGRIEDEPRQKLYAPYGSAGHFNYNVDLNTGRNLPFRVIRDMVVLPNPGDHELMLAKAYFQVAALHLFYCYFLLGHRQPIEHEPW
jgi:hypothetical protein